MRRLFNKEEGFTLIEMSLVLFIISALLLLFIPNLSSNKESAASTGNQAFQTVLQSQVEMYVMDNGSGEFSFADMEREGYLTPAQLEDTKNYTINDKGIVVKNAE
ncbi:competence type IV pilus major pilin ComGC [Alkalibacterium iburiense]|uniref:Competence type IV pilus major pilin ComGC n=1 Tax=Alkalibacterium iburiense TaxID=290589 RepID=A0ABN0X1A5_9LACT